MKYLKNIPMLICKGVIIDHNAIYFTVLWWKLWMDFKFKNVSVGKWRINKTIGTCQAHDTIPSDAALWLASYDTCPVHVRNSSWRFILYNNATKEIYFMIKLVPSRSLTSRFLVDLIFKTNIRNPNQRSTNV